MAKKKHDEIIQLALERFGESMTAEDANRESSLSDIRFENGEQWDSQSLKEREGRPCLVINKTAGVVKQIIGDARQNRPRIKVRPVDDHSDPKTAELLTGLIRNIENVSDAEAAYDNGFESAVRGGYGYWRVLTDYADDLTFEQDIMIRRIVNPHAVYFDQAAVETDYSDARYAFICETMTREEFENTYPNAEPNDLDTGTGEASQGWFSPDSVRVAEYWWREPATKEIYELIDGRVIEVKKPKSFDMDDGMGQTVQFVTGEGIENPLPYRRSRKVKCHRVKWAKITASQVLEGPQEWAGKYIPIVPCLGEEIWIEGERILRSAIRFSKDPQKLYNWARSTAAETIALAPKQPWIISEEQVEGHESQWQEAHRKPQSYLLYNNIPGQTPPQRLTGSIGDSGALQEAMQAADDIKATTGLFDASLGAQGNETSGKAIIARQRESDTATFVFTDNQTRALKYTGKILVDLIPKIYDTERVVRLLNEDGSEGWDKINVTDPVTGESVANDLSVGRYDVVVDAGPGYMTKRLESADGLVQILSAAPNLAPLIVPRIAKNLDWPESDELAEEIRAMNQPQQQGPDPKEQMDMAKGQVEIEGKQLDNQKKQMEMMQSGMGVEELAQRIGQIEQILTRMMGGA
jgi:hypothetical protein